MPSILEQLPRVPLLSDIPIPFLDRVPLLDRALLMMQMMPALVSAAQLQWNDSASVADRIEDQAERLGDKPFVFFEERWLTYRQWNEAANRVAHWAEEEGLSRGTVVALLMENRPEFLVMWAGLAKAGVTTALLNTNLTGQRLRHSIDAAGARHVIVGSECVGELSSIIGDGPGDLTIWFSVDPADPACKRPAWAEDLDAVLEDQPTVNPDRAIRADVKTSDELFYIYTSGTTGLPKAARFSHLRFLLTGDGTAVAMQLRSDDTSYCALPLYHSAGGVMVVSSVLSAGATIALRRKFSASQFWNDVRRYKATTFQYIGEFCRYLLNLPARPDDTRHDIRVGIGNGLRPDIWPVFQKRFAIPQIIEFYGATESNTVLINLENKVGSVGRYLSSLVANGRLVRFDVETEKHVRDESGLCIECKPGEIGELVAPIAESGAGALGRFEGYTSKEDTEKKILRNVFAHGDACFRTGDLLRQDDEGFFYFVDRIGDTFRWKGENVSTQEVAEAISSYPGAEMVNVYGVAIEGMDGRAGMAAIRLADGAAFDGRAFYDLVERSGLPRYAAPVFVRLLGELDLTGTLKLRKVDLQAQGYDPQTISDPLYLRDDRSSTYVPLTAELAAEIRSGARRP